MADRLVAKIVVTDTAPLITLAVADRLDYLLYLDLPVVVPDGVFYEATIDASKLGASAIGGWVLAHPDRVHLAPTSVFTVAQASRERVHSLGELSAIEAVKNVALAPDERAILLLDDARAHRRLVLPQSELIAVSTGAGQRRQPRFVTTNNEE